MYCLFFPCRRTICKLATFFMSALIFDIFFCICANCCKIPTFDTDTMLFLIYEDSTDVDYDELTHHYMGFFSLEPFQQFLNTTQNGAAHSSSGIGISILLQNVATSLCFCIIQLTCFCLLRSFFKFLYQPRCYYVPISQRMEPLPRGLLTWILPTVKSRINFYLSMGLDAYYFVRFVCILLLFFISVGLLNMVILIPVNFTGSDEFHSATGLDQLSLSNIAISKVGRLRAHFFMSLVTIGGFHVLLLYELESFVKIRQTFLLSKAQASSIIHKTLLVSPISSNLMDTSILERLFLVIPGGIQRVWFVYDCRALQFEAERAKESMRILEQAEMIYLSRFLKKYGCDTNWLYFQNQEEKPKTNDLSLQPFFYPPIYIPPFTIPFISYSTSFRFPGFLRIFAFQRTVCQRDWALQQLQNSVDKLMLLKTSQIDGKLEKLDKVFVQFSTQAGAYIAHQTLLSQVQGNMSSTQMEVHPQDILWENLRISNSIVNIIERYTVTLLLVFIIIAYVVPVSFIGLISQLPLLTKLVPSLKWVYNLPEEIRDSVSSFLPAVLLTILTDLLLTVFRFLTYYKRKFTGAELEIDLQKWYFAFLFVQQFLVVTILTSIIIVFKQVIEQPTSIPILLAANLPKAATFFFQYFTLKAFAFCGYNFLRIDQLILHHTWYKLKDRTPRQKFHRLTTLPRVRWGSVYPVLSVYGSIGLAYCLISPLISLFLIFILVLIMVYYKYALKFIYSHVNVSETYGRLYPVALFNLYTGIYCLECCLIGIFFSLRSDNGECPLKIEGILMSIVLVLTIFANINIYNKYVKHFSCLPILQDKKYFKPPDTGSRESMQSSSREPEADTDSHYLNKALLYAHPAMKYERGKVWLPKDKLGESDLEVERVLIDYEGLAGGSTKGATMELSRFKLWTKTEVMEAPPDYK